MHFLQSESLGFPPLQSQRLIHFDLEVPRHKHRAMQRISGTHDGQPYFIWSRMQSLHPLVLDGHPRAGEVIDHNISSIISPRAKPSDENLVVTKCKCECELSFSSTSVVACLLIALSRIFLHSIN
ncbi:hypothetical protein CRYUN_Cryun31cG0005600 [Craigia yunnanensis]